MKHPSLDIDCDHEVRRICSWMREAIGRKLHRRGAVLGLSGGVDSSVCAALAVQALGPARVFGLLMPEFESSAASRELGGEVARQLGISHHIEQIGATVEAIGCYRERDAAIRRLFPDYGVGWRSKISIAGGSEGHFNFFKLVVQSPEGARQEKRLPLREYLQIVAATNHKQRIRKTIEYYHADRLNYAVIGTPNRLEYDQGFFVKNGDGAADIKPIAHLYKTQVYALARHLGLPATVCNATPTTDTYSLQQGQDEFYFALPYEQMDLALWSYNHGVGVEELALLLGVTADRARFIYSDIEAKRNSTRYLHTAPLLIERIDGVDSC